MSLDYCFNPTNCALRRRPKSPSPVKRRSKPRKRKTRSKPRSKPKRKSRPRRRRTKSKPKKRKKRLRKPTPPPPSPPKKKRKRRRRRSRTKSKTKRRSRRHRRSKSFSRSIVEKPRSKVVTETSYETWVCDPDDGVCRLVRQDYSKGSADKVGRYQGPLIPANDANLLDLASGLDGATYCAVADGLGQKWVKCGTKEAENCDCNL